MWGLQFLIISYIQLWGALTLGYSLIFISALDLIFTSLPMPVVILIGNFHTQVDDLCLSQIFLTSWTPIIFSFISSISLPKSHGSDCTYHINSWNVKLQQCSHPSSSSFLFEVAVSVLCLFFQALPLHPFNSLFILDQWCISPAIDFQHDLCLFLFLSYGIFLGHHRQLEHKTSKR